MAGNRAIASFVAIAYGLSCALSLVVGLTGGYQSPLIWLRYLSMVLPTAGVLIVSAVMKEGPRIDWNRFPLAYVAPAVLLIPVTMHAAMLSRMAVAGPLPWVAATPGRIVGNAVVGLIIASILSLFEEIGWRGWLLPRLMERMHARRAIVLTAVIWAFWHVPFGLSGIQHIDGASPMRVALGIPIGVIAAGLVIGWLWVRTQSIWIVALAHGSLNGLGQYAFKYMSDFTVPDQFAVLGAGMIALYLLGGALLAFGLPRSIAATHR